MKMAMEVASFTGVIFLFGFSFAGLFMGNNLVFGLSIMGIAMLMALRYLEDRRSARRRKEYWNGTGL